MLCDKYRNIKKSINFIMVEINTETYKNYEEIEDKIKDFMFDEFYEFDERWIDEVTKICYMVFVKEHSSEIEHILTAQKMYKTIPEVFPYISSFRMVRKMEEVVNTNLMLAVGE